MGIRSSLQSVAEESDMSRSLFIASLVVSATALWSGCPVTGSDDDDDSAEESVEPTVADVLDGLRECVPLDGDGRIDLAGACANGACASMSYGEMNEALGEEGDCMGWTPTQLKCTWSNGIYRLFTDADDDGIPDEEFESGVLWLDVPYDGSTAEGLGVDVALSCFLEVLGYPHHVEFYGWNGDYTPSQMQWYEIHGDEEKGLELTCAEELAIAVGLTWTYLE